MIFFPLHRIVSVSYKHLAVSKDKKPILIICSYNPAAHQTSVTISDYMDEYSKLGGQRDIIIENMNCKSFSAVSYTHLNVSGMMPNGDPAPKRNPKDGGKKTMVGLILGAIGTLSKETLDVTNPDPSQDSYEVHTKKVEKKKYMVQLYGRSILIGK